MAAAIFRYEVPVDDAWHALVLSGPIVHVDARTPHAVEVWALTGGEEGAREFIVVGTGHPLPDGVKRHLAVNDWALKRWAR